MKLTHRIFLLSFLANACGGPVSVEKPENTALVETQLIPPKNPGEPWARKISLKESSDIAGWIVEKQNFSDDGQIEEFKSIGVLDSSGEFVDEHIDKNKAVYKIGSKWNTQVLPAVKDLVVDTPALCAQGLGALQVFESFRIVFRLPKHDQRFLLEGCQVQIHSNIFVLDNSVTRKNSDLHRDYVGFDLKIVSKEILYNSNAEIDLSGSAGENGKPAAKGRDGIKPELIPNLEKVVLNSIAVKNRRIPELLGFSGNRSVPSLRDLVVKELRGLKIVSGDGGPGANANNGENGGDGGILVVYSPRQPALRVNVSGGMGGAPSQPGEGGDGGAPIKIYMEDILKKKVKSPEKIPVYVGIPGKKGPRGKVGKAGQNGKAGSNLWFPTENTSQMTGIYAENIAQ
jgi:hypothetical protein